MSQSRIKKIRKQQRAKQAQKRQISIEVPSIKKIIIENWKFLVILLLGVVLLYINSLWGDFVSDDYATILNNPDIRTKWAGGPAATDALFNIPAIIKYLIALMFGVGSPIPFHIFSVFMYMGCILVGFVFVNLLFGNKIAIISTILFVVHPIHVEAVSWISGVPYLYLALFQFLSYIGLIMVVYGKNKYYYLLISSIIFSFLSAKIHSFAFVFVAPLIVLFLAYKDSRDEVIKIFWKLFGIVSVVAPILLLFLWPAIKGRVGTVNFGYRGDGSIFYNPFFQYPTAVTKYLQLLFLPIDITLYHTMYTFPVWLNWVVITIYLVCLMHFWFKDKKLFFALSYIFLATIPAMAPVKVSWLTAERYMFLGSIGWCIFLALIWQKYFSKFRMLGPTLLGFFVVLFATKTFLRNIDWQTNHNLWVATVQVSSNSHNAWNNIGDDYDKLGDYENAIKGFSQSTFYKPNYADAYHNKANIYFKTGYLELARESYETALKYNPNLLQTYISLTQIDLNEGDFEKALDHSQKAVELASNNFQVHYVRGVVMAQAKMTDEAKKELEICLKLNPDFQPARNMLLSL